MLQQFEPGLDKQITPDKIRLKLPEELEAKKTGKKGIAILGSHPETVAEAPFNDPDWLIYACSPDNHEKRQLPRVDEWFEIHLPIMDKTRSYRYLRSLENLDVPIWMRDVANMQSFKNSYLYPAVELMGYKVANKDGTITQVHGEFHRSSFKSSIAFMMAKAIMDCQKHGIKQMGLWGILQAHKNEYMIQRPSTQYFIEEAQRRGITVYVHPKSQLHHDDPEIF